MALKPYTTESDQAAAVVAQLQLLMIFVCSILFDLSSSSVVSQNLSIWLTITTFAVFASGFSRDYLLRLDVRGGSARAHQAPIKHVTPVVTGPAASTDQPIATPSPELLEPMASPCPDVLEPMASPSPDILEPMARPSCKLLEPIAAPSSEHGDGRCANCGAGPEAGKALLACARCRLVSYCDQVCQRVHWKNGHTNACQYLVDQRDSGATHREEIIYGLRTNATEAMHGNDEISRENEAAVRGKDAVLREARDFRQEKGEVLEEKTELALDFKDLLESGTEPQTLGTFHPSELEAKTTDGHQAAIRELQDPAELGTEIQALETETTDFLQAENHKLENMIRELQSVREHEQTS